jgi:hypothetical protein
MIFRLTTLHENAGSAGILPAVAGHRALDDVASRMPALPFSWQSLMPPAAPRNDEKACHSEGREESGFSCGAGGGELRGRAGQNVAMSFLFNSLASPIQPFNSAIRCLFLAIRHI